MATWQAEAVPHGAQPVDVVVPSVLVKSYVPSRMMTRAVSSPRYDTSWSVVVG